MSAATNPGMDRAANNRRLREIVDKHRAPGGEIPALSIAALARDLTALMDDRIDAAYEAGWAEAREEYAEHPQGRRTQ